MNRVRPATVVDVPAMQRLRLQVRENVLSDPGLVTESMVLKSISEAGSGWVFEENNEILGFSIALRDDPSIWALFVLPQHEGKGIGHTLLKEAVDWLWSLGAIRICLGTEAGTRAERFYRERGWKDSGLKENGEIMFVLERKID